MRREHSWCSDGDISPCPSPVGSPMHAAALATPGHARAHVRYE
jgi:hypothetical protein